MVLSAGIIPALLMAALPGGISVSGCQSVSFRDFSMEVDFPQKRHWLLTRIINTCKGFPCISL